MCSRAHSAVAESWSLCSVLEAGSMVAALPAAAACAGDAAAGVERLHLVGVTRTRKAVDVCCAGCVTQECAETTLGR